MRFRRPRYLVIVGAAVVVVAAIVVAVVLLTSGGEEKVAPIPGSEPSENRVVTDKVWPAPLALGIPIDATTQSDQPADVALIDGAMYLVAPSESRILEMSADGKSFKVLDKQVDPQLALSSIGGITSFQGQLFVTDATTGRILVVSPAGTVVEAITLAKGASTDQVPPFPVGIAVWSDGSFAVSDGGNDRLTKYGQDGHAVWSVGSGTRATGENGFNAPIGVALDKSGNVYVVDSLNSAVKKYSPDGKFLLAIGQAGNGAGDLSRPKGVAVDDLGNVYVSDGLQAAVEVYDQSCTFVGVIVRKDPADKNSDTMFQAPDGLKILGGKLYVVDRFAGIFVFNLPTSQPASATQPSSTSKTTGASE